MAHGFPDWGEYAPQSEVEKSLDVAELAARLGSPCLYDRRGTVIFMDNFSTGINRWEINALNTTDIFPSAKNPFISGYSLAFYDDRSWTKRPYISIELPYVVQTLLGGEGIFSLQNANTLCYIEFTIVYNGYRYEYSLKYDRYNEIIRIEIDTGDYITIASNIRMPVGLHSWFSFKLVINPLEGKYVRARFNNQIFDISNYLAYKEVSALEEMVKPMFVLGSAVEVTTTSYLGFVIITQNE